MLLNPAAFRHRALTAGAALCLLTLPALAIPAFPGAEGYGANATGGRGGDVYHVTNLNNSGAGSFAEAISTVPSAGRTIVFDVSGHIHVNKTTLSSSKVTIAGQTAPGDGIGFKDGTFIISGDDIIIRHARFRYGQKAAGGDCIDLSSGTLNAILDQVSIDFSTDENISSFKSPPENLTLQWSLNGWGLESHSCGGLWDQNHASSHHSLWAHNHTRNPKARPNGLLEWINNVTFDWDIGFIMGDSTSVQNWKANVRGCYFLCPPGNLHTRALEKANLSTNGTPNFSLYLDNCLHDADGDGLLNGTDKGYGIVSGSYTTSPSPFAGSTVPVTIDAPLLAFKKVLSKAGALRLEVSYAGAVRDEVDAKMINNVLTQTRNHISRETALGLTNGGFGTLNSAPAPVDTDRDGMPDFYETALGWNTAVQDHNTALASSGGFLTGTTFFPAGTVAGYTRLEEYLFFLAMPHGTVAKNVAGTPTSIQVDLRKFTTGFVKTPVFTVAGALNGTAAQSGTGNYLVTFTPTVNYVGRAKFDFTVTDTDGSAWTQTCALLVSSTALPRDLLWKGDGSSNVWDGATGNWLRNAAATVFSTGDRVTFDDTGSLAPAVNVTGTQVPGTVEVNATGNCTFGGAGAVTATATLTKRGTGTLTLNSSQTYSGGGSIEAGTVALGTGGSLSGGTFTMLDGATLANVYPTGNSSGLGVALNIPAGQSATFLSGNRFALNGALTGDGTFNYVVQTTVTRADLAGPVAAFTGHLNFSNSGGVRLIYSGGSFNGFDGASVDVGGSVSLQPHTNSGGNTCSIGALSGGSASANLAGGDAGAVTYIVGANGTDTSYAGGISGNAVFTKTGAGALTLTGTTSHTGATIVNAGELIANGVLGASAVTVASGAKLRGAGSIAGAVTMQAGAQLSPGAASGAVGTLTLGTAGLSLANMTTSMQLSSSPAGANDKVHLGGGSLGMAGALTFTFTLTDGFLGAGEYFLIDGAAAGTSSSVTFAHNIPNTPRQTFTIPPAVAGQTFIKLVVTGTPVTLLWKGNVSGVWDTAGTANWLNGAAADFFQYNDAVVLDDTAALRSLTLNGSLAPRGITVNTATAYTLGGTGTLDGTGALVKNGAGTLTFAGTAANAFSGGLTLNAGTIVLANDAANAGALGTGPVTLNGGTVSMHDDAVSYDSFNANLVVPAGAVARLNADARVDMYGTLTGAGTLNFYVPFVRTTLFTDWSAFTGTINVLTDGDGGDFRMGTSYSFPGFPQAAVVLSDKVWAYYTGTLSSGAGTTIEIGELAGTALAVLEGGATGGRNFTYRIGGKNTDAIFAGTIQEQNTGTATAYVKTGTGTWTLGGACTWNGGTAVEAGTLKITGSVTCGAATEVASAAALYLAGGALTTDALNIASGATFTASGNATLTGDFNNDGTATVTGGTFACTGDVVNNGTMRFLSGALLTATGAFVNNGLLDLLTSPSSLPANFQNNGVVLLRELVKVASAAKSGSTFTVTIASFSAHTYQLLRADTLAGPWNAIPGVPAQNGAHVTNGDGSITPTLLTLTDPGGATGTQRYYRVGVSP